jgi:CubicO group peptidase (beta-lactamase class C family)
MSIHRVVAAALVLILPVASPLRAQQATQQSADPRVALSDSAIRAIIKDRVDSKRATGIVVGLLAADGRSRVFAYGASGTARPLDAQSVFEIGSITKTFTAAVLADMVAKGEVKLDDPVAKYLPADVRVPSRNGRQITLLDLATQSSGLPRMPTNFSPKNPDNPYVDYTEQDVYAFLKSYELPRDVGATYEYSNLGMGLLGIALARKDGRSYEAMVKARVLDPLSMGDSRITLSPQLRERLALGHDVSGKVVSNWDITGLGGAGALRSTMTDMLAYLAANIDSTRGPLGRVLASTHGKRHDTPSPRMSIGLAWHILSTPAGGTIVWHNGGTGGYRTYIGFDPARRIGAVVLTNSANEPDDIGVHLIDPSLPLRPPALPQGNRKEIALAPSILDRYVGEYDLGPQFHIVVTRDGSSLFIQATNQPKFEIYAEREDEFFLKIVDAQISFVRDSSGKVTAFVLHQNGQDQRGPKVK